MNIFARVVRRLKRIVQRIVHSVSADLDDLEVAPKRLRGRNTEYQKFVLLAHARSGSSMVVHTLNKHPSIVCFGEVFVGQRIGFNVDGYDNASKKLLYLRNRHPMEFLNRTIFPPYSDDVRAVGFKLFPDQFESGQFKIAWDWLCSDHNVKIILLRRLDMLAAYTSLLIARQTNFGDGSDTRITIDLDECLREFEDRERYHEDMLAKLGKHDLLEVFYEDMTQDLSKQFIDFQEFIGVDMIPLEVESKKKEVRPLSEVITNYEAIHSGLTEAGWGKVLEISER